MFRCPKLGAAALLLFSASVVHAQTYRRDAYRDIEALGRGNSGLASVSDGSAAFYNPAGLARGDSYRIDFADGFVGGNTSFKDSYTNIQNIGSAGHTLADKLSPFLGEPLAVQGGIFSHIMAPGLLLGVYDYADTSMEYHDPVNPTLSTNIRNDYGIITGAAKNFGDRVYVGASIRYYRRRQIIQDLTASSLLVDAKGVIANIQSKGSGWGLNTGVQYRQPVDEHQELMLGATIEDLGQTHFQNDKGLAVPLKQYQMINFGLTYGFSSPVVDVRYSLDMRNALDDRSLSYTRRLFTGIELGLPAVDVRAGLFQGYWTAGLTIRVFPLLNIDIASYAEELGSIAGQRANRFYMLGIHLGTELRPNQGKKQKLSLDNL